MVSLFFFLQIKGERPPFIGKGRPLSLIILQSGIASHKGINLISLQILGVYKYHLLHHDCNHWMLCPMLRSQFMQPMLIKRQDDDNGRGRGRRRGRRHGL